MRIRIAASVLVALAGSASAQSFVNGTFETGDLSGWTVVNTPNGAGAPGAAFQLDIDGPGPLETNFAAGFMVGNVVVMSGSQAGVEVTHTLSLTAGVTYTLDLDWSAQRVSTDINAQGGVFSFVVEGEIIATAEAGSVSATLPKSGHLTATFTPAGTGDVVVGVRITRPYTVPGDLTSYIDNVTISGGTTGGCYANCDQSTTEPILNVADFSCFLQAFGAGSSYANCDESTTEPVIDVADFSCFLQAFAAGCP